MSYPISLITCPSPFELGVVPVSPGILHTSVSSQHLHLLYQRSNLSPRNDCPNMVCSVGTEISFPQCSFSQCSFSPHQATSISTPLAAPSPADAHDLAAHSIRLPDIPVDCYTPEYNCALLWQRLQSALYSGISVPKQYGIGNAREHALTFQNIIVISPKFSCGDNSVSGCNMGRISRDRLSLSLMTTS